MKVGGILTDDDTCLSVCLSSTSTLKLHSAEGAAISHDTTISCYGRGLIVSTYRDETLVL